MTVWIKKLALYIDVDSAGKGGTPLLDGKASSRAPSLPVFVQGDKVPLELYFRTVATSALNASAAVEIPAGTAIVLDGKLPSKLADADSLSLFSSSAFAVAGADDDLCYQTTLDLTDDKIEAAFVAAPTVTSLTVRVDVELQNADNSDRLTFQFDITLKRQVYKGEPVTTGGAPSYYNAEQSDDRFVQIHADGARVVTSKTNKREYVYIDSTGLYYPRIAQISSSGLPVEVLGDGVEEVP
jgi:hypothetical protein